MKPKTKAEHEVVELSAKLTPPTSADIKRAKRTGVYHFALYSGKRVKCVDCGHEWQQLGLKEQVRCPHCLTLLKVKSTRAKKHKEVEYFIILQSVKAWQVTRYFRIECWCHVKGGRKYEIHEVVQHWIRMDGKHIVMARPRYMSWYLDSFCLDKPMSIKGNINDNTYRLPFGCVINKSINPVIKRNGFKSNLYGMQPYDLFYLILTLPFAETLLKAGYGYLLRQLDCDYKLSDDDFISAARIVIRNHYQLDRANVGLWVDMVGNLQRLGRDVRNRHYVCPDDLKAAHDRSIELVKRMRERERAEEVAEQLRKDKKLARSYTRRMKKYFGMVISDGNIVITVLKNLAEFEEEGRMMHHCVFENKYFAKRDSLVMSAKVDGMRQETVEVSLKRFTLIQSRGVNNQNSKYHDEIVSLVNANMPQIRKLANSKRRAKKKIEKNRESA